MGRCQGGFCGPLVTQIIHEELQIPYRDIYKKGYGTIILKMTKDETYDAL
jgi:glycerol-3-phosphate dehydrogenase